MEVETEERERRRGEIEREEKAGSEERCRRQGRARLEVLAYSILVALSKTRRKIGRRKHTKSEIMGLESIHFPVHS